MKAAFYLLALIIMAGYIGAHSTAAQPQVRSDTTVCQLRVPASIKQASANFVVSYSFKVDKNGVPSELLKIKDDYVGKSEMLSCLGDWRFTGFVEGSKFTTVMRWKHGLGWVEVLVLGPNFAQTIKIKEGIGY